jgi:hypothetical protein
MVVLPLMLQLGAEPTVTVVLALAVQPLPFVTTTE